MEDNSSQELIAEGNCSHSIRKQKLINGILENDGVPAGEVMGEQSTASETRSNNAIVSKKAMEQCSSTITKKQKKSIAQKLKLIPKSKYHP